MFDIKIDLEKANNTLVIIVTDTNQKHYKVSVFPNMVVIDNSETGEIVEMITWNDGKTKIITAKIQWVKKQRNGFRTIASKEFEIQGDSFELHRRQVTLENKQDIAFDATDTYRAKKEKQQPITKPNRKVDNSKSQPGVDTYVRQPKSRNKKVNKNLVKKQNELEANIKPKKNPKKTFETITQRAKKTKDNSNLQGKNQDEVITYKQVDYTLSENEFFDSDGEDRGSLNLIRYVSLISLYHQNGQVSPFDVTFKKLGLLDQGLVNAYGTLYAYLNHSRLHHSFVRGKGKNLEYDNLRFVVEENKYGEPAHGNFILTTVDHSNGAPAPAKGSVQLEFSVQMVGRPRDQYENPTLPTIMLPLSAIGGDQKSQNFRLKSLFNIPAVKKKFGSRAQAAILHDLRKDGIYFVVEGEYNALWTKDFHSRSDGQAYPIETSKKHILGNMVVVRESDINVLFGKRSSNVPQGTKIACLNILNRDKYHIGKIYLTK